MASFWTSHTYKSDNCLINRTKKKKGCQNTYEIAAREPLTSADDSGGPRGELGGYSPPSEHASLPVGR